MPAIAEESTPAAFPHHGDRLLYKIRDAARMLSLGETKVWELIARGDIESVKIDGARRVSRDAIEAYVTRLRGGDHAEAG